MSFRVTNGDDLARFSAMPCRAQNAMARISAFPYYSAAKRSVFREDYAVNSIKPLITIAILGGIGYIVYTHLNSKASTPPPGAPTNWDAAPTVQIPGENPIAPRFGGLGGTSSGILPQTAIGGNASAALSGGNSSTSVAPSFTGAPAGAPDLGNGSGNTPAPSYQAAPTYDNTAPAIDPNLANTGDKWGTTDPSAAVQQNAPAVAQYGDATTPPPVAASDPYVSAATNAPGGFSDSPINAASDQEVIKQFQAAWTQGNKLLEEGKLVEGLTELSIWHGHPALSATESQQLTSLLDQVAGSVIYSTQHYLEPAHVVKEGERLEDIGQQYNVPAELVAKINGIDDPTSLRPGEQLKVVRGPFNAVIQLQRRQLTLMLGNLYAGRFVVGLGRDMPAQEGTFAVTDKVTNPVYYGRERTIAADDPGNPLGERWIAIGDKMGIHGVSMMADIGSPLQPGSISLGDRDIGDIFDILSVGSKVMILR